MPLVGESTLQRVNKENAGEGDQQGTLLINIQNVTQQSDRIVCHC